MTFADAISYLNKEGRAAKLSSWAGYAFRTDDPEASDGSYFVTFRPRAYNASSAPSQYRFRMDKTTGAWTVPAGGGNLTVDAELFAALVSNNWQTGSMDDFEAARSNSGTTW